jgi:hypothetical protein
MMLLALTWPYALVASVAIAGVALVLAVVAWQVFAIVVRADKELEHPTRPMGR